MLSLYFATKALSFINFIFKDFIKQKNEKIILIVPEQYSFYMEKKIYEKLKAYSIDIEVLSFKRLAHSIFKKYGYIAGDFASKSIKIITLHFIFLKFKNQLNINKNFAYNKNFLESILEIIENIKKNKIEISYIEKKIINIKNKNLITKIKQLIKIYNYYEKLISCSFKDPSNDILKADYFAKKGKFFENKKIYFYNFIKLTKTQLNFISTIISQTDVSFFMLFEKNEPLFKISKKTIDEIKYIANKNNIYIKKTTLSKENIKKSKAIKILEKNIFRVNKKKFEKKNYKENLKIIVAKDKNIEIETVVANILRLIKNGISLDEINIFTPNLSIYENILKIELENFKIPYFIDKNLAPKEMQLIKIYEKIIDLSINFDIYKCLDILKSGLTKFKIEDIAIFENYIESWKITKNSFKKPFKNNPAGFILNEDSYFDETNLKKSEKIRYTVNKAIEIIIKSKPNCKDIALNIFKALDILGIRENLEKNLKKIDKIKIEWTTLTDIVYTIFKITKKNKINKKQFKFLFNITANNSKIKQIPKSKNSIYIGPLGKEAPIDTKATFIVGVDFNNFLETKNKSNEFLTEKEIYILDKLNINFCETPKQINEIKNINIYKTITNPSTYLFISTTNFSKEKSFLLKEITNIFGEEIIEKCEEKNILSNCLTKKIAIKKLHLNYYKNSQEIYALKKLFEKSKRKKCSINLNKKNIIDYKTSPSKIEQFYKCPFSYYCKYMLKIKPNFKFELNSKLTGSIFHKILEKVISIPNFCNLSSEEINKKICENLKFLIDINIKNKEDISVEFEQKYSSFEEDLFNICNNIKLELTSIGFNPIAFEYKISYNSKIKPIKIKISENYAIYIEGIIDRIDLKNFNNINFIRIIDYKSKKKDLNYNDILKGLNLQPIIYIMALQKSINYLEKKSNIFAMLFSPVLGDIKNYQNSQIIKSKEEVEKIIKKGFISTGIIINSNENELMLEEIKKEKYADFRPIRTLKNNSFNSIDREKILMSEDEISMLFKFTKEKIKSMYKKIEKLKFYKTPIYIKNVNKSYCEFCDYKEICCENDIFTLKDESSVNKKVFFETISKL